MTHTRPPRIRQRVPWLRLSGIFIVVAFTLGSAAANMKPNPMPSARELQEAELDEVVLARRTKIALLQAIGDRCVPAVARELARELVFDGRPALEYAADYERRCGDDPIVRRWAEASRLLRPRRLERVVRI